MTGTTPVGHLAGRSALFLRPPLSCAVRISGVPLAGGALRRGLVFGGGGAAIMRYALDREHPTTVAMSDAPTSLVGSKLGTKTGAARALGELRRRAETERPEPRRHIEPLALSRFGQDAFLVLRHADDDSLALSHICGLSCSRHRVHSVSVRTKRPPVNLTRAHVVRTLGTAVEAETAATVPASRPEPPRRASVMAGNKPQNEHMVKVSASAGDDAVNCL